MKRELAAIILGAVALSGCTPNPPASANDPAVTSDSGQTAAAPAAQPAADESVATVRGANITMKELEGPLVEAYGLNVLLEVVQLELAQQEAGKSNIQITPQDVQAQEDETLIAFRKASHQDEEASTQPSTNPSQDTLTPVEHDRLLSQLLTGQHISRPEFTLAMQTNAYLRKLVEPQVVAEITDKLLHDRFNTLYGEKAQVRFIRAADLRAMGKIEAELKAGHTFQEEQQLHRLDASGRPSAGDLAPFTVQDQHYPPAFKTAAFLLKPGEISQAVSVGDSVYLIQLVELIPPQHANFDDYKDSIRQDLLSEGIQNGIALYRQNLGIIALQNMEIKNPTLKQQWDEKLTEKTKELRNAEELKKKLQKEHPEAATREAESTTEPTTKP